MPLTCSAASAPHQKS